MIISDNRPRIGIRLQPENQLTFPVILHHLESLNFHKILDLVILKDEDQLRYFISKRRPSLLLYSFMTPHISRIADEILWIKQCRYESLSLVAGGPHTRGDPVSVLKMGFDYAFTGAVEMGFAHFVEQFTDGRLPDAPAVIHLPELDDLDRSFPMSQTLKTSPPLEITRGCYWNCKFCQTACLKAIHRSFDSIQKYYEALKKRGHQRRINFICPSAFEYKSSAGGHPAVENIEQLLGYFQGSQTAHLEFGIFPSETRPNTFSGEMVKLVKRFCSNKQLTIGAQAGSDELLKITRRGHTVEDIRNACRLTAEHQLQPHVDFIFGFPGETSVHRRQTLRLIKELYVNYQARTHLHYFIPLSGTDLADSQPREIDYRSLDTIEAYEKGGICTGWWREGQRLAEQVLRMRERLRGKEVDYQELDWRE